MAMRICAQGRTVARGENWEGKGAESVSSSPQAAVRQAGSAHLLLKVEEDGCRLEDAEVVVVWIYQSGDAAIGVDLKEPCW
jgi:hypothetical protein